MTTHKDEQSVSATRASDAILAYAPLHALAERMRSGGLSASTLLECYLDRIRRLDGKLHAFIAVYADEARAAAQIADRARESGRPLGPLHGIPIALKDLIEIEGRVTTGGSMFWRDRVSPVTATIARRLTAAGMIVLGKTHLVEFAFGSWGTNTTLGTPWNPWDLEVHRTPGGSSSGSAVAVAAALAPAAIGSDTGGSVRAPAALCGIVGLKTTVGRVSNYGTLRLSETLDTIGPITRDVEDAALLFSLLAGPDACDPQTLLRFPEDVLAGLRKSVSGLRLAVLPAEQLGDVDADVAQAFAAALDVLRDLGMRIDTAALPLAMPALADLTGRIIAAEGYALNRAWIDRDDLPFDTDVRSRLRAGKGLSAADYLAAMTQRRELRQQVGESLRDFDALVLPTTPVPAMPLSAIDQNQAPMSRLTRPINLLDLCALSLPCGVTRAGLPISLQIVGASGEEARILRIGQAFENATGWHARRPTGLD